MEESARRRCGARVAVATEVAARWNGQQGKVVPASRQRFARLELGAAGAILRSTAGRSERGAAGELISGESAYAVDYRSRGQLTGATRPGDVILPTSAGRCSTE
jgi:hypothetical protein